MKKGFLVLVVAGAATFSAQSQLTVNITGVPDSGQTTWAFSGTVDAPLPDNSTDGYYSLAGSATRDTSVNLYQATMTDDIGTAASIGVSQNYAMVSGDATVTGVSIGSGGPTGPHTIDGIFLNDDGDGSGNDDFAWYATGSFLDFNDSEAENFEFSGSSVFGIDITSFGIGGNAIVNSGDEFTTSSNTGFLGGVTMTFTAVPEPAEYAAVAGLALLGFAVYRKRRKCVASI